MPQPWGRSLFSRTCAPNKSRPDAEGNSRALATELWRPRANAVNRRAPTNKLGRRERARANARRYHAKSPHEVGSTGEQRQKRAVAEYLSAPENEAPSPGRDEGGTSSGRGQTSSTPSRQSGLAGRSAIVTTKANKRVQFAYSLNYLIDVSTPSSLIARLRRLAYDDVGSPHDEVPQRGCSNDRGALHVELETVCSWATAPASF